HQPRVRPHRCRPAEHAPGLGGMIPSLLLIPAVAGVLAYFVRRAGPRRALLVLAAVAHAGMTAATWVVGPAPVWGGSLALAPLRTPGPPRLDRARTRAPDRVAQGGVPSLPGRLRHQDGSGSAAHVAPRRAQRSALRRLGAALRRAAELRPPRHRQGSAGVRGG